MNTILAILAAITVSTKQLDTINNDDSVVTGVTSYFSESDTNDVNGLIAKYDETNLTERINAKQDTLVSGENIKTVNGETLLDSGDIVISGMDEVRATNIVIGVMGDKFGLTVGTGLSTNFIYHTQKYEIICNQFRFVGDEGGELQFIADSDVIGKIYTRYDSSGGRIYAKGSFRFEKSGETSDIKPDGTDIATLTTASNIVASATNAVPRIVMGEAEVRADLTAKVVAWTDQWNPSVVTNDGYVYDFYWSDNNPPFWKYQQFQDGELVDIGLMTGDVWNPNATELTFPEGTQTHRIPTNRTTRLVTTNDLVNSYTKNEIDTKIYLATNDATIVRGNKSNDTWDIKVSESALADSAMSSYYAEKADNDGDGNNIISTYATKAGVSSLYVEGDWIAVTNGTSKTALKRDIVAQVQANWTETDTESKAFIKNKPTIPSTYLKSATSTDTSITVTKQDDTTVGLEVQYDYALTNLTGTSVSLASGEIGNVTLTADTTVTLDFSASANRSGDCLLYLVNNDHTNDFDIIPTQTNGYHFVSADLAKALTIGKETTNIVSFTRLKSDTILVSKLEVK